MPLLASVPTRAKAYARFGTDASNYIEWRWADSLFTAGAFTLAEATLGTAYVTGTGWAEDSNDDVDLDYLAVGAAFDAETNTLADIKLQRLYIGD